ncbi:MAG: phage portal protein [Anaerolineae bacterium]
MPLDEWRSVGAFGVNDAGANVTPRTALTSMPVFAAIRLLAESVAMLPWHVYERTTNGKNRANNHPLDGILNRIANPEMSAFTLRETMMVHVLLWGNAYAEIEMNNRSDVRALWPLHPANVKVGRDENGNLIYAYQDRRQSVILPASRIFHVHGLSSDGIVGYSPIQLARGAIGLGMATEKFGAQFFANGARPGGVLEHPSKLTTQAYDRLKASFEERHQGLDNAQRLSILEEGMKYSPVSIPPEDAQFLQTRKYQVSEIARLYRVPAHMIGDLDRATFSNIEQMSIEFVTYSLVPWLTRWEQDADRQLLSEPERKTLFTDFLEDALLRGETLARYQAYAIGRQWGWLSANDVRDREDMNHVPGGDAYFTPLNMSAAGAAPQPDATQSAGSAKDGQTQGQRKNERALRILVGDAAQRVAKRTQTDRDYVRHGQWVVDVLTPVCDAIGASEDSREQARGLAEWWLGDGSLTWIDLMNKLGI